MSQWEVVVGNVGTVYSGSNGFEAKNEYSIYKRISEDCEGHRAYREPVTLFRDSEIYWEHQPLPEFEIREGNGNDGAYPRGTIRAVDAFKALELASRRGMISKPKDVTYSDFDGDHEHAYAASYVAPIWGDACRWIAESHLIND